MSKLKLTLGSLIGPCVFAVLLMAAGCHKVRTVPGTFWTSVSPEADRIVARLEAGYSDDYDSAMFHSLTDSLELLTKGNKLPPPILKSQVLYWKAYMAYMEDRDLLMYVYADSCAAMTDSAAYPYEYARAHVLQTEPREDYTLEMFKALVSAIKIYKSAGDSLNVAKSYSTLGTRMFLMTFSPKGLAYLKEGRKYTAPDSKMRFMIDFNIFQTYSEAEKFHYKFPDTPRVERYKAANSLLDNSLFQSRPNKIKATILNAKYEETGDIKWLRQIDTTNLGPRAIWLKPCKEAWLTQHFVKTGERDSATLHFNKISRDIPDNYANKEVILAAARDYYDMTGKADSAAFYDKEYRTFIAYSFHEVQNYMAIVKGLSDDEIGMIEQGFKTKEKGALTRTWICTAAILLLCGAGICLVVRLLRRRYSTDTRQLTQELDEVKRRQMVTEVKSSDMSKASAPDWEKVESLFVETNPKFIEELYRRNPGLTPGDVRMACFTLMGMETKHIARLLSINPASVAKNRYRLRQKLGLGPDQTLDAFLHSLASTLPD